MSNSDRIELSIDPGTWNPMDEDMVSMDPIEFHSEEESESYKNRMDSYQRKTGLTEAVQTGTGQLNGIPVAIGIMDFQFMGGSMGSVVGEKITRLVEHAGNQLLPLILVCASGGARMQEGSLSLMQMAKISSALYEYQKNKRLFYVSILTSPTTGGVTASFGMLGDIIIAEPDAYIAFAAKSAQFPLHVWLPDAMEGPTPISALIHAATMVAAGIFLVARLLPLFIAIPTIMNGIAFIGIITLFLGATLAIAQKDIKRNLAYSTMSQLGYMMLALGSGSIIHSMETIVGYSPEKSQNMVLMAPECFSLCSYLLSGYTKKDVRSNEATTKYLLMGGASSSILVHGFSWIYGSSGGEIELQEIVNGLINTQMYNSPGISIALIFITVGIGFKLSNPVPTMHFSDRKSGTA
ncbi:hypothetical protein AHAS_Ahas09G0146800 [Arachis hypogaea]